MIELSISFWHALKGEIDVPFYLLSLPSLTPEKSGQPTMGRWSCASAYLGRGPIGEYYVKNINLPTCSSKEQKWTVCRRSYGNPVAFFFDFGASDPFLALYTFNPMHPQIGRGPYNLPKKQGEIGEILIGYAGMGAIQTGGRMGSEIGLVVRRLFEDGIPRSVRRPGPRRQKSSRNRKAEDHGFLEVRL
jgi:hypothetical protein